VCQSWCSLSYGLWDLACQIWLLYSLIVFEILVFIQTERLKQTDVAFKQTDSGRSDGLDKIDSVVDLIDLAVDHDQEYIYIWSRIYILTGSEIPSWSLPRLLLSATPPSACYIQLLPVTYILPTHLPFFAFSMDTGYSFSMGSGYKKLTTYDANRHQYMLKDLPQK